MQTSKHDGSYNLGMRAFYHPSTHTHDASAQHNDRDTPQRTCSGAHTQSDTACDAASVVEEYAPRHRSRLQLIDRFTDLHG